VIHYSTIPARADFAFQQLVGPHKVSGAAMNDLRGYFGLVLNKTMPFGCVRDDDGHIYAMVRALMSPTGTPNPTRFLYQSTRIDGQNLRMDRDRIAAQAATLRPVQSLEGDTVRWTGQPGEPGAPWEISASGESMRWREEGLFDIGGPLIGVGMQWFLPGVDWGTYYVAQLYDVSGTCEGRAVKGIISIDQAYMAEGGAIHFAKDLVVLNNKHVIWWNFATIYKDGSFDVGSFMVGHDNLGYAIFQNEKGEVRSTTSIEGVASHKPGSYFADKVQITLEGGETWEFLPDPKGEMIDFVGGFPVTAQQEGRWRRVGDTREPDRWFGWGETDRRNGPTRNVAGADI
jgi:hypothetical protein